MSSSLFIGQAQTAIDGKGRSSFPREFRRQLLPSDGEKLVVTRGPARTLRLYTLPEYEKFMADLDSRSDRRQADLVRRGLCPTVVELDGQNRILLPKILLEYAGLKDEVLYVQASGKTLELWNPERFNAMYGLTTEDAVAAFDAAYYGESLTEGDDGRR
ncbi:MAG: MraZ family transcriptional regulator [Fibrobacter sp.]|jgi:MraZ protein|uniref:division/cell wall cluster transcriptional repressor MraZ n=1 Tax=unclassified Fibrobacter TaxID=2634177 RepID=UPI000919930D|nr:MULTISPECIES: MraZ family transcriptional regulator [unclassified Fibrobacter]MBO5532350.1 MraZ family transcriptional regulator [Fibrobacter sp.]MBS7271029.1 MraZ family transcriptional regulator [Fibrobacter sp.]MCI6436258.1 MraZ family transcriptional regulator [Fibrobacter sp.]MDD5941336.1 MraZ family transcriptional regulator [Fibrobacter sp.]MDD7498119.1 MraZ family transcriptional regulator [Fibrobacter sp.]